MKTPEFVNRLRCDLLKRPDVDVSIVDEVLNEVLFPLLQQDLKEPNRGMDLLVLGQWR